MKFQYPIFLYLIPAFVAFCLICFALGWHLRRSRLRRFLTAGLLERTNRQTAVAFIAIRHLLLLLAVAAIAVALARPLKNAGTKESEEKGSDVIIALDISRSMGADDLKPNRFAAAREAIEKIMDENKDDRFAIIAFAGDAYVQTPLTADHTATKLVLEKLKPGASGAPGTNIGQAIQEAIRLAKMRDLDKLALLLVTDGENLQGDALGDARTATVGHGITIFPIGIGTPQGSRIPLDKKQFVKDPRGTVVQSRLDEPMLRALASMTGGQYHRFDGDLEEFERFYGQTVRPAASDSRTEETAIWEEWYYYFAGAAFGLLFLEPALPTRKRKLAS